MGRSVTTKIVSTVAGKTGDVSLDVVDVSGAAPLASPTLTGIPKAPTAPVGTSTEQLATTEFVSKIVMSADSVALTNAAPAAEEVGAASSVGSSSSAAARSDHVHAMPGTATTSAPGFMSAADKTKLDGIETGAQVNDVTSVAGRTGAVTLSVTDVSGAAPSASPSFTGTPTAPTAAVGTNTTQVATTAFVKAEVANNITSGTPAAETVGAAGTVGTSSAAARSDHVHAMPGTATTAAPGFMSAADKTKLDGVASGAAALGTSAASALGTASAGSATTAAKSDHVHPLPTLQVLGAAASSHTHDLSEASVKYAATAGRAYPARADGVAVNFNWVAQTGQPQWVWGGDNGQNEANYYVYNPSNFSVGTARNLRPGANMGIVWDNDAFGGGGDTASITLESGGGENMAMMFRLTNDATDVFRFWNASSGTDVPGVTHHNDGMTLNGHVILNAANYDNYAPSRLRRSDGGDPYYLQHKWSATPSLWRLDGYKSDGAFHAGVEVARADSAKNVDSVPWTGVTGAPATYAPSAHTHDLSNASVNYATSAGSAGSVAWTGVTGAPATYAPSAHTHDYAATNHTHDYAAASHTHNYAASDHTHNYAATNHTHDYAAASHTHNKLYSRNLDANYTIEAEWDNGPGRGWRLNGYYQGNFHDGFGVKYADSVTDPGSSKLLTGYVKLPGSGLIIQWGRWAIGDIQIDLFGNITFPIAFPNLVFQVNTTLYSHNREAFDSAVAVTGHSTTGFDWTIQEWSGLSQTLGMAYIAIGY